ncbi:leucine-rich repeat neuronal protein 1-like [Orussus abietinus]|uniref:leucine-rich repeat neuronal protein 1-like n=1 Tax=Orussus abietinus TaxID=222816 RepID=UPI000626AFF2|nr:leucine-rich repeat neuronal protein 1-like [Orussus abietinus]
MDRISSGTHLMSSALALLVLLPGTDSWTCETCSCTGFGGAFTLKRRIVDCGGKLREGGSTLQLDGLRDVVQLQLSSNEMAWLPKDVFGELKNLTKLDLSSNLLRGVDPRAFQGLPSLQILDLSGNQLKSLDPTWFQGNPGLTDLNLHGNLLESFEWSSEEVFSGLLRLDLSYNNLKTLSASSFESTPRITHLDLSFNRIREVEEGCLLDLEQLVSLNISNNNITRLLWSELPVTLTRLNAGYNLIEEGPRNLSFIQVLDIAFNNVSDFNVIEDSVQGLTSLNVSGNRLTDFPSYSLDNLETLDVSDNSITRIPESFRADRLPRLRDLLISGNPIKKLFFKEEIRLKKLVASRLPLLEAIDAYDLSKISSWDPEGCIDLVISGNGRLSFIHEDAFESFDVCYMNLSYNNLSQVHPKLFNLESKHVEKFGIDIQGNPFFCNCTLQWMVDTFVPLLYSTHQGLLVDLRCASPASLRNKRMVHWYKWPGRVLCGDKSAPLLERAVQDVPEETKINIKGSTGMIIVLIGATVLLSLLVIVGIVLAKWKAKKRSRQNRRF